ncbi:MAG: TetR/AcrR family transcriptional regulator [Lentisphaeraceae bacterium]|nr:TetR/AcrR family transcriptional regulator [Lentisphaeraceae bacterium]
MRRKEPEKAENLLRCALKLFSERGIAKVNIDAIAAEAGVTKGSVYHHFKSKHELILGACQHYYQSWQHSTYQEIAKAKTSLEKLELAIRHSVKSCLLDNKNRVFTLEVLTLSLYDEDVRRSWSQFLDTCTQFYIGLCDQAMKDEEMRLFDDVRERVNYMLCTMEGVKQQAIFDRQVCSKENEQRIVDQLFKVLTT